MLPFSVRRAVAAVPLGLGSALGPAAPLMAQRRASSSKPSRPDNDSSDVPADRPVASKPTDRPVAAAKPADRPANASPADRTATASPASSRPDAKQASDKPSGDKPAGDKRKRKPKETIPKNLPYVSETRHITKDDLGLSAFFSQHRPISITQSIPKPVTNEQFASIFSPRMKNNKSVATPLANPFDRLESSMSQMTIGAHQQQDGGDPATVVRNADGTTSGFYLDIDAMAGDFLPFRPPPLPQPTVSADAPATADAAANPASTQDAPQYRKYRAIFTIEETVEPDGQYRVVAHSPRIVRGPSERSFLERMARRQLRFEEAQAGRAMHAISVRRQRKLKMKKKKYKKLQKRTRNSRRKNERS
ncbi:hypothetical protein XA68_10058 [Ophiocordyceps unilateralis]|uniref:Small ribosomal subunit protein mS38 n=1 Tax=Ophiocordyceps unilateralis TaxID=268505 RepID=A0A2A9PRQ5_OPHUN|nr:hypothetical protein XA68_10058 [Ophiocordyceps unilateralis]